MTHHEQQQSGIMSIVRIMKGNKPETLMHHPFMTKMSKPEDGTFVWPWGFMAGKAGTPLPAHHREQHHFMKNDGIPCTFPVTRMKEAIMSYSEHHFMTNNSLSMRGKIHEESGYRCGIGWSNNGKSDRKPLKQEVVEIDSEEHLAGNWMMAKMKTVWQFIKSSLVPLNGSRRSENDSGYRLCRDIWDIIFCMT